MSAKKKIILLVDDDSDDRYLFEEAVGMLTPPITCHTTEDGQKALHLLQTFSDNLPQIIFLDINMPIMNGWQCLKELKSNEKLKNIPVIMYSTSSHQREIDIAIDLGALCFCVKPESFEILKKMLQIVNNNLGDNLLETIKKCDSGLFKFKKN